MDSKKYWATSGVPAFNLRMPRDLRLQIERSAQDNQRSINSEIIHRLRVSIDGGWHKF